MSYLALFACDSERCRCGIEDPRDNQMVWAVHAMAQSWGSGLSRSDTTSMDESQDGQNQGWR